MVRIVQILVFELDQHPFPCSSNQAKSEDMFQGNLSYDRRQLPQFGYL